MVWSRTIISIPAQSTTSASQRESRVGGSVAGRVVGPVRVVWVNSRLLVVEHQKRPYQMILFQIIYYGTTTMV